MGGAKRRCGNVNEEIEEEVLVKLPVKSLVRFKSVSKEWRERIESTYFIEKHIRYQKSLETRQARIVAITEERGYNGVALDNMLVSANGVVHVEPYQPIRAFNRFDGYYISNPCDGLFCIYTISRIFTLVNPATTSRRKLPVPEPYIPDAGHRRAGRTLLGIGRENGVNRRYKLLWFFDTDHKMRNGVTRCKVFALDSNTWRNVDPPPCEIYYHQPLIHLDGVMYFFAYTAENRRDFKVLAFDLHTETSLSFPLTPDIGRGDCHELSILVLKHRVCIFRSFVDNDDTVLKIWGIDIDNRSWETMHSVDLSCLPPEFKKESFIRPRIIPVATINNYVIIKSNVQRETWLLYGSKKRIFYHTSFSINFAMSYFEMLVSAYQ